MVLKSLQFELVEPAEALNAVHSTTDSCDAIRPYKLLSSIDFDDLVELLVAPVPDTLSIYSIAVF